MSGEILSNEEMRRADAMAVAQGTPSFTLMTNAGRAVADVIVSRFAPCRVAVLCGPGNNGGDGFVVAQLLSEQGFDVALACADEAKGDAAIAAAGWHGARGPLAPSALDGADLIVDALFGAGLSRPPEGGYRTLIEAVNRAHVPVIAIDIPSGIDGDSGQARGIAVEADITVTFFRLKPAHLLLPGRILCGESLLADIGIPQAACVGVSLFENSPSLWGPAFPWPRPDAHKYARGHCLVVSGPAHATGAARLAARGALRIGAGLVSVAAQADAVSVNAAHLTAIMVKPFDGAEGLASLLSDRRLNAAIIGPGLGVGPQARDLLGLARRVGRRQAVGGLVDPHGLCAFEPLRQNVNQRSVDVVDRRAQPREFGIGGFVVAQCPPCALMMA